MKKQIIDFIKKYYMYILFIIIVVLIIIIGFVYSNRTTKEVEQQIEIPDNKLEEHEENIIYKVDIKGQIKNSGVYELEEGKRIIDVITKAGGLLKDADTSVINLSKKITDEMVIIIYSKDEIKEFNKKKEELKNEQIDKEKIVKYEEVKQECICPNNTNDACIKEENIIINETKDNNKEEDNSEADNKNEAKDKLENSSNNELININSASKEDLLKIKGIGESKADAIIDYREENLFKSIDEIKNVSGIGDSLFEKIKDYITT